MYRVCKSVLHCWPAILQRDERERIQLQKIIDNTLAISSSLGNVAGKNHGGASSSGGGDLSDVLKQLTRTRKKMESIEESLQNRLSVVANEV